MSIHIECVNRMIERPVFVDIETVGGRGVIIQDQHDSIPAEFNIFSDTNKELHKIMNEISRMHGVTITDTRDLWATINVNTKESLLLFSLRWR